MPKKKGSAGMGEDRKEDDVPGELEFNEADLEVVEISDSSIEAVDTTTKAAQKEAKKLAKKLRTPEEKKRLRRKKIIIGSGIVLGVLGILLIIPFTRWKVLNAVGFRGTLVITTIDTESGKPVTKASVKLEDGSFGHTNKEGVITFAGAKLGERSVLIQKSGYGDEAATITNKLGTTNSTQKLKPIGIKLDVDVKNWLSGVVIEGATVSYKESSAVSDKAGRASLIIPPTDDESVEITVAAPNYITKIVETKLNVASREVQLVSSQKDYFISKRDGKFDIFSSNLDGTNQQKIIEATGKEDDQLLQFSVNRTNKQAILVATREGKIQNDRIVAGVYLVDLEKASLKKVDEGSDVQLLGWSENSMVYQKSVASLNYDDPAFNRIANLNVATGKLSEIAQSNYFSLALLAQNKVFYARADAYRTIENASLTSQDMVTNAKKTYLGDKVIRYGSHTTYDVIELQDMTGANYQLQAASGATKAIDHRPGTSHLFALSPNAQQTAWNDQRDGRGALLTQNVKAADVKTVVTSGGLTSPVRFVTDDLVIVRIVTSQETADYVVSITSGKITKVVDVSNF